MRLFGKKDKRLKKESRATRWFRILLWRLFVRWKIRERIAIANKWADDNRGDTMLITVGCLLFSLILGAFLTLSTNNDDSDNFMSGVEPVESLWQRQHGTQKFCIGDMKSHQKAVPLQAQSRKSIVTWTNS